MTIEEARNKLCPLLNQNCIVDSCMMWTSTFKGNKIIARHTYPNSKIGISFEQWSEIMKKHGYENFTNFGAIDDIFVKYKYTEEGYCKITGAKP